MLMVVYTRLDTKRKTWTTYFVYVYPGIAKRPIILNE